MHCQQTPSSSFINCFNDKYIAATAMSERWCLLSVCSSSCHLETCDSPRPRRHSRCSVSVSSSPACSVLCCCPPHCFQVAALSLCRWMRWRAGRREGAGWGQWGWTGWGTSPPTAAGSGTGTTQREGRLLQPSHSSYNHRDTVSNRVHDSFSQLVVCQTNSP